MHMAECLRLLAATCLGNIVQHSSEVHADVCNCKACWCMGRWRRGVRGHKELALMPMRGAACSLHALAYVLYLSGLRGLENTGKLSLCVARRLLHTLFHTFSGPRFATLTHGPDK